MPPSSKFSHRQGEENLAPEEIEARRRAAEVRGELLAPKTRRHAWLNIAGPLGAVIIAIILGAFYKKSHRGVALGAVDRARMVRGY